MKAAQLPPLDPEPASQFADVDRVRRERYLRMLLARGDLTPARNRMVAAELRALENARAPGD